MLQYNIANNDVCVKNTLQKCLRHNQLIFDNSSYKLFPQFWWLIFTIFYDGCWISSKFHIFQYLPVATLTNVRKSGYQDHHQFLKQCDTSNMNFTDWTVLETLPRNREQPDSPSHTPHLFLFWRYG